MKKLALSIVLMITMILCCACKKEAALESFDKNALYFDTIISLKIYDRDDKHAAQVFEGCMQICEEIEHTFSRTMEGSELYNINHRIDNTVEVSADVARLTALGLEYYEKSGGKFDITVAPLSDTWDFKSKDAKMPDEQDIHAALAKVDAGKVHVDTEKNIITFDSDDTMIDLGAIVKGYAADKLRAYLQGEGIESALINLGGNVLAVGLKPDGTEWNIGIQQPFKEEVAATVRVNNQTVVSSGIYERYFEQDGVLYHHILDPDTGYPIQNNIWGVSIITDSSEFGDVLSTTCLTLGVEDATRLIDSIDNAEALFILDDLSQVKTF